MSENRKTRTILLAVVVALLIGTSGVCGYLYGDYTGWVVGYDAGLKDMAETFQTQTGINVSVRQNNDGSYTFTFTSDRGQNFKLQYEIHCTVKHFRSGILLSTSQHPMNLTNFGKNWIANKTVNTGGTNVSTTYIATWIGLSNNTGAQSTGWTTIPNEIMNEDQEAMNRSRGTYAPLATGNWNVSRTFNPDADIDVNLYGYYVAKHDLWENCLIAFEQQTEANRKNLLSGDTLRVDIEGTIS